MAMRKEPRSWYPALLFIRLFIRYQLHCVCDIFICVYTCVQVPMYQCAQTCGAQKLMCVFFNCSLLFPLLPFSFPSPLLFLKIGTLTECETHKIGWAAWPASPGDAPNSFPVLELQAYTIALELQAHATRLGFYAEAGDLNSGASACVVSTLLTQPAPRLPDISFFLQESSHSKSEGTGIQDSLFFQSEGKFSSSDQTEVRNRIRGRRQKRSHFSCTFLRLFSNILLSSSQLESQSYIFMLGVVGQKTGIFQILFRDTVGHPQLIYIQQTFLHLIK